jgi:adenine-specific DNA-methyltransferase
MQNLLEELKKLLEQDERLVVEGKLLKNKIIESSLKLDVDLIRLLLKSETIKTHFFQEVDGVLVFDKIKFQKFVSNKAFLPDSYTSFKNKIGPLTENEEYLSENKEAVLVWPYKDCVLEGGQEKEDEKRKEIFHNEILTPDEIDRLLEPKVFTNSKRIDAKREYKVTEIKTTDNLIIKGNNLLVLHSLKKRFTGKVKLIYIDPPYNTGNDEFKYNDNFNHSTWLTFMKNRLEIAKELLREDGIIFVQMAQSPTTLSESPELGYLLVLMDEIFGRKNYLTTIIWKKKGNPSNTEKNIGTITESILMYAKNIDKVDVNLLFYKRRYKYEDEGGSYNLEKPIKTDEGTYKRDTMKYEIINPITNKRILPPQGKRWTIGKSNMEKLMQDGKIVFKQGEVFIKKYENDYLRGGAKLFPNLLVNHGSLKSAKNELANLGFEREDFESPKPEILMKTLIEIVTIKKEIVLDFFLGSGTTCAVAHKMGRQYIGVEQMEYFKSLTLERMKKVLCGEQGGVSEVVDWGGGGDFIYLELMELNEKYINKIQFAKDDEGLMKIWKEMKENAFLSYKIEPKDIDKNIEEFKDLSFENQKKFLIECLDKNQIYINLSEIDDTEYEISKEDKELNNRIYEVK